ncbi:MAG TPA: AAA family ATPase [Rectinemataceae bacterium]|nr:AAA family ATPase [Rectinemataceae bacterium]
MTDPYMEQIERVAKEQDRKESLLSRLPKGWNGKELMTTIFPPTKWSVVNLIPTGAILLSGVFKVGKSWMMLQLADCVSRGKPFLGHETNPGAVLYLALEDGPARIQHRALRMGIVLSETVHVFNSWLPGSDGIDSLSAWLEGTPARLVIIDTLSRWQDDFHGSDIWARDTKRIADLKAIADLHDTTVLIVHHRSKATREDIHQSVAGTNALQGAADGSLILDKKRGENTAKLSIVGRDIPEGEYALEFIPESCTWKALDIDPSELALNTERRAILDAIRELGGTARTSQIAQKYGKSNATVSEILKKLIAQGMIVSPHYGEYAILNNTESTETAESGRETESQVLNTLGTLGTLGSISGEKTELDIF